MLTQIFILAASLFLVVKGATLSTKYAERLASNFNLSKYATGFIIVAIISILPETFIALNAAFDGTPEFGLGTLFGSNVADLTLVFAAIILITGRGLKIESRVLKNRLIYPLLLLLPLILGLDGAFTRFEGAALMTAGIAFYYSALKNGVVNTTTRKIKNHQIKNIASLIFSLAILLVGAHFTVQSASALATIVGVSPILIGLVIVGLGTTMPELFFSIKSIRDRLDSLAVGDILGTVLADATIVVGLLGLIHPFSFPIQMIYLTGLFMVGAAALLFYFMYSGHTLSRSEARFLLIFWLVFVIIEFLASYRF